MDFMDLDVDLEANPVEDFLKNKLEEIELENTKLAEVLEELEKKTEEAIGKIEDLSKEVIIEKSWIKLIYDKYAICYSIKNNTKRNLKNCRLLLSWNSTSSLLYKTCIFKIPNSTEFNKNFEQIQILKEEAHIVAVVTRPDFLEQLDYEISGLFYFTIDEEDYNVELPEISLVAKDATDRHKIVPIYKLIELHIPDFVSCLASSNKMRLVMKLCDVEREIDSILEIDAALYRINFDDKGGRFFIAHKISPIFDGCIVEVLENENSDFSKLIIYYSEEENLISFVHHLYQNIKSLILLPEEFEIRLHSKSAQDCEVQIKKCMSEEIKFAKEFQKYLQKSDTNNEKIREFLNELCDLEHETDKAYIQLRVAQDNGSDEGNEENFIF